MPKINIDCLRKFFDENRDIILPALCIFGCGLAIGLAVRGSSKGTVIRIVANNGSSVTLDGVIAAGAHANSIVLED